MTPRRIYALSGFALAMAAAIVMSSAVASAQCAMCRTALQSPQGQHLAAAFRGGILLLLAAPFAIFGAIAALAIRMLRRDAPTDQPR